MEHTRSTIASLPSFYTRIGTVRPQYEKLVNDKHHFSKFAFDVLYAAHCLHTRAHMVHGDLHGNNFTMHQFVNVFKETRSEDGAIKFVPVVERPVIAYVAGPRGEADTYVFPYTGLLGCIIDYSRVIMGPALEPELKEEFGPDFPRGFYRDQVARALRTFHRYAPTFVEANQAAIKAALLDDFDLAFRVMSYVDFIAVGAALVHALTSYAPVDTDLREFRPAKDCVEFARRVEKRARERLIVHLHDLVGRRRAPAPRVPFAGEALFADLFADYRFAAQRPALAGATLCDAYNHGAPLRWDGRDYEKFPPWARLDKIEEKLGGVKIAEVLGRGVQPFLDALLPSSHLDIIADTVRAEQEALDRPAAPTSSWID
jgi:hypothetical protein